MGLPLTLYNLLMTGATLLFLPVILVWLTVSKKARSGFRQKLALYFPKQLREKLAHLPAPNEKKRIWLHAVSVGEFNAIRPLINQLKEHYTLFISTTTRTGQHLARKTYPELPILYFPYDFRPSIHQVLNMVHPDLVVITETEIWPNFIDITTRLHQTPLIIINGRLSPGSFKGYQRIHFLMKPTLKQVTHFYMQSSDDAKRAIQLGAPKERVSQVGNIKFDMNPELELIHQNTLKRLFNFNPKDTVLTLASTHSGEEQPLIEVFQTLRKDFPELKLVIAPRHPERVPEIKNILNTKALPFCLRSQLSETHPNKTSPIIILDTIGELVLTLSLSSLAIMGGSFIEHGGQNPLEPLSQKIPVIFGPHMFNFGDITRQILEHSAGFQVKQPEDIIHLATELLTQPERYDQVVENGQHLLEKNRGTQHALVKAIQDRIKTNTPSSITLSLPEQPVS